MEFMKGRTSMERRFDERKEELLADCEVPAGMFRGMLSRLRKFVEPFLESLFRSEGREHAQTYVAGLLSNLKNKNAEAIAFRHDEPRWEMQDFLGQSPWDHQPMVKELVRQVGTELGQPDAVIVFDPSGFAKKGTKSVGVARQWLGRLGKVDNGQVAVYMGYASRVEHTLVDMRLYLPKEWTNDKKRCAEAGVPKEQMRFRTRHELALEMLDGHGEMLPHAWVAGDDEMGRSTRFRRELASRHEHYLLAVPSNTTVRDLEAQPPQSAGRGRKRKVPFRQVRKWVDQLPEDTWTGIKVRDGDKEPLRVEIVSRRVQAKTEKRRVGPEETLVVIRYTEESGTIKHDYYLSNAPGQTSLKEFARVAKEEHRIEESIKRAKSEAGLADYQVRNWLGWHHHQVLSLLAVWFLVLEGLRDKKWTPAITVPQIREALSIIIHQAWKCYTLKRIDRERERKLKRNELAYFYHYKARKKLAPLRVRQR
jgi:SRSO17 transposase